MVLLGLGLVAGCSRQSPVAPASASPMISGYTYEDMVPGAGEPPLANVSITVTDASGVETTTLSDRRGFYSVRTALGTVVVTAAKAGYTTRQSRFEVADSTVLNFSMRPAVD